MFLQTLRLKFQFGIPDLKSGNQADDEAKLRIIVPSSKICLYLFELMNFKAPIFTIVF
jgi:hypothetical protein